jgi:DNA-directed RNA polymerase specialized sigma24 family protein
VESDSQLVARAQSGDQPAFAELVRRHSAAVLRLAVSILGREFIPEAEDVTQEVFLKVHLPATIRIFPWRAASAPASILGRHS